MRSEHWVLHPIDVGEGRGESKSKKMNYDFAFVAI